MSIYKQRGYLLGLAARVGIFILILILSSVILVGTAQSQMIEPYSGIETYSRFCASCHGADGAGDGPVAAGLPISVPDLRSLKRRLGESYEEEFLRRIIDGRNIVVLHGTRYMPVWGYEFWVEEGADEAAKERVDVIIDNLLDHIDSIQIED